MWFSVALCRGLIEADATAGIARSARCGFPRLYAAASLKPELRRGHERDLLDGFPRLYAAASLKLGRYADGRPRAGRGFPRLYAAASLKHCRVRGDGGRHLLVFRGSMPRPH